jgi:hypothetical protein
MVAANVTRLRAVVPVLLLLTAGCATLEPDTVLVEAGHESSIAQHFESHDPNVGVETLGLAARWQRGRWFGEASEAYAVTGMTICAAHCPRDVFEAHVGYELWVRP